MRKKIFGSIAVLAVVAVTAFNINKNKESAVSNLVLANIEALANNEDGSDDAKCKQNFETIYKQWLCGSSMYSTQSGMKYSLDKSSDGTLNSGKSGFEGTITNECAANPYDKVKKYSASTVNC